MPMNKPQYERTIIRIKGPYRIINYELNPRPIFLAHGLFKRMMTNAGGRLPLAGVPAGVDIDLEVKLDAELRWRDKQAVAKLSDLAAYPVKGLAPGTVFVEEARCNFLFYGNCWWHLDQTVRNTEEPAEEEEGQQRFTKSIDQMEKDHRRIAGSSLVQNPSGTITMRHRTHYLKYPEKKDGL